MLFKKHISLSLAFLFLVSNLGLSFNVHFCKDKIESITLENLFTSQEIEDNCCQIELKLPACCKKIEKKKCSCENKIIKSDNSSEKICSANSDLHFDSFVIINNCFLTKCNSNAIYKSIENTTYTCNANAPPIFERNCQRLFYA
jgi:hypothetical protein